ncbi:Protein unc-50 homolog [Apodemus speciosus]|uniref:Protein unc-50 homolog n=1 Tax=Apodemus speciosus TaxID=105296 RepID=A0ABQ0ECP2_APOSI
MEDATKYFSGFFDAWERSIKFQGCSKAHSWSKALQVPQEAFSISADGILGCVKLWVSTIGFGFVLDMGFFETIKLLLWVVFIDCVGVGLLISTLMWFISNKYLVKRQSRDYDVEWGYAFDVHLNAFYPLLVILHFIQLFFINHVILTDTFIGYLVGNTLWLIAVGYYIYVTFLGYSDFAIFEKYSDPALSIRASHRAVRTVTGTGMELYPHAVFLLQVQSEVTAS